MRSILVITRRELTSYFDSLIAYVVIILFLCLTGFFTWLWPNNIFYVGQASLVEFFEWAYWFLFFLIPAITMHTIAEEKGNGTIELLSTKAINDWQIVTGKYLSSLLLLVVALICTLPYYISISRLGSVDHGAIIGGYVGLILYSSAFISTGIFASSLTNNQIIALLLALGIQAIFALVFWLLGMFLTGTPGSIFNFLSARGHFDSMSRGVFDSRDVLYFLALTFVGLLLSQANLAKRNWRD